MLNLFQHHIFCHSDTPHSHAELVSASHSFFVIPIPHTVMMESNAVSGHEQRGCLIDAIKRATFVMLKQVQGDSSPILTNT